VLNVPYARGGTAAAIAAALHAQGFALWGLSPSGRTDIRAVAPAPRMALLTGTEGEGLPPDILDSIRTARIAQAPGLDSLNAATATGIALFSIASAMGRV
jgi:tRNA G18 (ribose-2'-O)-methylase SpoU